MTTVAAGAVTSALAVPIARRPCGPRTLQMARSTHLDSRSLEEVSCLCVAIFIFQRGQNGSPAADEGVDSGPLPGTFVSPVHGEEIRVDTHGYRSARRRGGGRESEDGTGHQRADRSNGEEGGSEDVSPNAHDYLHA